MTSTPSASLRHSIATLLRRRRHHAIREATRETLSSLGPALRDDLGLTRHRQLITFQNDKHKKHSFD